MTLSYFWVKTLGEVTGNIGHMRQGLPSDAFVPEKEQARPNCLQEGADDRWACRV